MEWADELHELAARRERAKDMGGPENVERQHRAGRLTVRERIERLLDLGSFQEFGALAGCPAQGAAGGASPTNLVFGIGRIDGREVVVSGDDFTLRGGSSETGNEFKLLHSEQLPGEQRLPLIRLVEGSGGGGGSVKELETSGYTYVPFGRSQKNFYSEMGRNLAHVPVVGLCLGPIAGLGVLRVMASHYSIMVRGTSQMFLAGPAIAAAAGLPLLSKEELGGAEVHGPIGAVDDVVDNEDEALERTRRWLSYLPSSVWDAPQRAAAEDPSERRDDWLASAVPKNRRRGYSMRRIIQSVVDQDSFFEIGAGYGKSAITGFARLDGWPVALIASDPMEKAGAWTAISAQKIARMVDVATTFHLPMAHLVDCPGFEIGRDAEAANTARSGIKALFAINNFTGPWCTVIVRNCFGLGGSAHQPPDAINTRYAWPSARWGSLPIEGGLEAAYKAEIEAAPDPEAARREIHARLEAVQSPFRTAEVYDIEEIIDPRDTRPLLCAFARRAQRRLETGPAPFNFRP
jgi:acetyl-CoA carboxylase carboxyltransferase component